MRPRLLTVSVAFSLLFPIAPFALAQAPDKASLQIDEAAGEASQPNWPAEPVRAAKAMVVSDESLACRAGIEILEKGGNAVDAAVTVAFALAVVEPEAGNLGGGGLMLVRMADGRAGFVDYREEGPGRATPTMYVRSDGTPDPEASTIGYRAIAVPGTPAGLELALRTYGTMKLPEVMAPAIRLAEQGFLVSEKLARSLRSARPVLERFSMSRHTFLKDGALYAPGEILRQPELAATLQRIARHGAAEFYRGETAHELASEIASMGGFLTLDDLGHYRAKIREPLRATYSIHGSQWEVITSPPPSSGGIALIEALNILAPVELKAWDDAQSVHWVAETMRRIFADRAAYLADADFAPVPVRGLTDPRYAAELRATIDPMRASSSKVIGAGNPLPFDSASGPAAGSPSAASYDWLLREAARAGHTTHFSIVDAAGNAVANTYTINDSFGSGVTTATGFLANDEMDDFTTAPGQPNKLFELIQSSANAPGPGKRPLSSMTPTILLRDGRLSFVTGSPGGPRIISATLLSILNWMRLGMDAQQAINAPRFHHQWMPDAVYVERTFPEATVRELERRGYKVTLRSWIGQVEAAAIDPKTGERLGAPDARRQGAAAGF
jgi:gamma-glutamyltranspeptidase/glutathione hydrolase